MVPGSPEMRDEGTQYRQRPWATRSAARMLSTVPSYTVGVKPAARHISMVNWLNSGARASSASSSGSSARTATGMPSIAANRCMLATMTPSGSRRNSCEATCGGANCRPADAHVQAAIHELLELLGHPGLDLVDHQVGVTGLHLMQDLRHRVVAGVDNADPQRGRRAHGAAGDLRGPVHVSQD